MKKLLAISLLILVNSQAFAATISYDDTLLINVTKVSSFLGRAQSLGTTPSGDQCDVDLRQIEDGYYAVYAHSEKEEVLVGLDMEVYGTRPKSSWTKKSFSLNEVGEEGSQTLLIKEEKVVRKMRVTVRDVLLGNSREVVCLLPLK
jgi:hypothetical protein